jgi:hypothetical protein
MNHNHFQCVDASLHRKSGIDYLRNRGLMEWRQSGQEKREVKYALIFRNFGMNGLNLKRVNRRTPIDDCG